MKFKVGDRVRAYSNIYRENGKEGTAKNATNDDCIVCFDENVGGWGNEELNIPDGHGLYVSLRELKLIGNKKNYTYADLEEAPIGTKIIFENGYELVKVSENNIVNNWTGFNKTDRVNRNIKELEELKDNWANFGRIVKIEEPIYTTVYKYKDVLDGVEKEYLSAVIKPFKNRVKSIKKIIRTNEKRYAIKINLKDEDCAILPDFKSKKMYKGMKVGKEYSIKELGLED